MWSEDPGSMGADGQNPEDLPTRLNRIATFLALLELARLRQLRITQDHTFGEIMIAGEEEEE